MKIHSTWSAPFVLTDGRVLLCKRNIEPALGQVDTLPMPVYGIEQKPRPKVPPVKRTEKPARNLMGPLFSLLNVPQVDQVHMYYRCPVLLSDQFNPGFEAMEARLFTEEIPWDELAFRTVKETLQHYFADRQRGHFELHLIDLE